MDDVSLVREKTDLVAVVSQYLKLSKAGRNFRTVCPFHQEKTPSFVVSPERQIWHCFGCGKGGDAFTFLMEYENMEFVEALRFLAKSAGVSLSTGKYQSGVSSQKEKLQIINKAASDYYHYILMNHPAGKEAFSYLVEKRGLSKALIETFKLGFSPPSGKALSQYLISKKKSAPKDLEQAGVSVIRREGVFDFFRGRIMFPISDHRGNLIGFSARALGDEQQPKYINTKETLLYHKGKSFYNLDRAKEEIKKEKRVIIAEGEFDVISMFSQGIKNAVAIKGTALTQDQAALMSRFTDKVSLCLDTDEAGFEAVKRSLDVLEKKNFTTTVVVLTNGKDADEAIKNNPLEFKKAVKNDIGVYDFLIESYARKYNPQTTDGIKKITDNVLPAISGIGNEIIKEHYMRILGKIINTSFESIARQIEKMQEAQKPDGVSARPPAQKKNRIEMLEEYMLALILSSENPRAAFERFYPRLKDFFSYDSAIEKLFAYIEEYLKTHAGFDEKSLGKNVPEELVSAYDMIFLLPLGEFATAGTYEKELEKKSEELRTLLIKNKIRQATEKLREKTLENPLREELQKDLARHISLLSTPRS